MQKVHERSGPRGVLPTNEQQEIECERQALKLLRGDYERVIKDHSARSALAASQGEKGLKEPTDLLH